MFLLDVLPHGNLLGFLVDLVQTELKPRESVKFLYSSGFSEVQEQWFSLKMSTLRSFMIVDPLVSRHKLNM